MTKVIINLFCIDIVVAIYINMKRPEKSSIDTLRKLSKKEQQ